MPFQVGRGWLAINAERPIVKSSARGWKQRKIAQNFPHKAHDRCKLMELYHKPKGVLLPIRGNFKKKRLSPTSRQNIVIDTDDTRIPPPPLTGRACRKYEIRRTRIIKTINTLDVIINNNNTAVRTTIESVLLGPWYFSVEIGRMKTKNSPHFFLSEYQERFKQH